MVTVEAFYSFSLRIRTASPLRARSIAVSGLYPGMFMVWRWLATRQQACAIFTEWKVPERFVQVVRSGFRRFAPLPSACGQIRQFPGPLGQDPAVLFAHGSVAGFAERPSSSNSLFGPDSLFSTLAVFNAPPCA